MSFNIADFKANGLKLGGARPNQFEVDVFFPFATSAAQRLKFLCRAASVPPMVIDEVTAFYFGRAVKYGGDRTFPDWELTIYNDEDFAIRRVFENWSNRINTMISNRMDPTIFPLGYKVDGEVRQLGKNNIVIATYRFEGMWPKIVDTMPLDWAAQNQLQEFNVQMAYDLWTPGPQQFGGQDVYFPTLADDGTG